MRVVAVEHIPLHLVPPVLVVTLLERSQSHPVRLSVFGLVWVDKPVNSIPHRKLVVLVVSPEVVMVLSGTLGAVVVGGTVPFSEAMEFFPWLLVEVVVVLAIRVLLAQVVALPGATVIVQPEVRNLLVVVARTPVAICKVVGPMVVIAPQVLPQIAVVVVVVTTVALLRATMVGLAAVVLVTYTAL